MTPDERAALVERLQDPTRHWSGATARHAADLIEADGKQLALADAAPHASDCYGAEMYSPQYVDEHCDCWKADYDAAKEPDATPE